MELIVLGANGSYAAPAGGACSGYLVREKTTNIWLDCGNGTFANLQRHLAIEDLTAVVITHRHPDHCVDIFSLHVMARYGLHRAALPLFGPAELIDRLAPLADFGDTFSFTAVGDGSEVVVGDLALRFSRTDHPPDTVAVELRGGDKRMVYTSDTGANWSPAVFGPGADLVLSEATYQRGMPGIPPIHLTAEQAGTLARAAGARKLVITHLWPSIDPNASVAEAEEAFGGPVMLAAPHMQLRI